MAKFQSPLLGYNNNVRHRGRIFHIQTEDSGVNHPHIITHLFMDGGRILKSVKKSYAEHVGSDGMSETVRLLMKEQHKAMFVALRDGQFDDLFEPGKKPSGPIAAPVLDPAPPSPAVPVTNEVPPAAATEKSLVAADSTPRIAAEIAVKESPVVSVVKVSAENLPLASPSAEPSRSPSPRSAPARYEEPAPRTIDERAAAITPARMPSMDPPLPPELEALLRDELPPKPNTTSAARGEGPNAERDEKRHRSAQELTLDFDALERDSGESPIFQHGDLPPPPKNLFAKESRTGTYSAVETDAHQDATRLPANRPHASPSRLPPPDTTRTASTFPRAPSIPPPIAAEPRHAPARPAASFGNAGSTPKQAPSASLFSDDLVSDKSLDEVILSYLAEDLDPPRRK
ncbi:MAG TPA: hypothetical protein VM925_08185 [Labilithrix sp.]|nr:hypothetical protein [Labilithrix sp.]